MLQGTHPRNVDLRFYLQRRLGVPESTCVQDGEASLVPDEALVLRGGSIVNAATGVTPSVLKNRSDVVDEYGISGLCCTVGLGSPEEVARLARSGHRTLRVASAGELRGAGFDVVHEPNRTDADGILVVSDGAGPDGWAKLDSVFSARAEVDNPNCPKRRKKQ